MLNNFFFADLEMLSENFRELYDRGKYTDVIIQVKDREFKVHKAILAARSPVFDAMFTHELAESNSRWLEPIEDCEPAVFDEFLFFVYTGRIQLSNENACSLFYIAYKYQISELKEECVSFLQKTMTIDTICDIICLSTKYEEEELLNLAINFFARNMEKILVTVKWQLFVVENPTEANELTVKALKMGFVRKKKFNVINDILSHSSTFIQFNITIFIIYLIYRLFNLLHSNISILFDRRYLF